MLIEMRFDLTFGFGEKTEAPRITEFAGQRTDGQRTQIPQRVEQALAIAEFVQSALGPGRCSVSSSAAFLSDSRNCGSRQVIACP